MRRALLTMMVVGVLVAATGFADPRPAEAQPGYFNFSLGTPGYYAPYATPYPQAAPYGYGGYGGYAAPIAPQADFGAAVPLGGVGLGFGYGGAPYGGYYRGYGGGGWPGYGYGHHYGHGHHHF